MSNLPTPPVTLIIDDAPPWTDPKSFPEYYDANLPMRRIMAYLIDVGILFAISLFFFIPLTLLDVLTFGAATPLIALFSIMIPLLYHSLCISSTHCATFGMRIMGLKVVSLRYNTGRTGRPTFAQALVQVIAFYLSIALTSTLILLIMLFNSRRRTFHDWISMTVVVSAAPFNPTPFNQRTP